MLSQGSVCAVDHISTLSLQLGRYLAEYFSRYLYLKLPAYCEKRWYTKDIYQDLRGMQECYEKGCLHPEAIQIEVDGWFGAPTKLHGSCSFFNLQWPTINDTQICKYIGRYYRVNSSLYNSYIFECPSTR